VLPILFIVNREQAPEYGLDSDHWERSGGNALALYGFGLALHRLE
jgi:hypothetical protein